MQLVRINRLGLSNRTPFHPFALAWADGVVGYGGSVSAGRLKIVSDFISAEIEKGLWGLTDDYLAFWAENAVQALTSLKQRRLATAVNSAIFTPDRSFNTDGAVSYIDTGFAPATHAVSMSANSVHFEVYERSDLAANSYAGGVNNTNNRNLLIRPRVTSAVNASGNSANGGFTLTTLTSAGLTHIGRNGGATTDVYCAKNGVDLVTSVAPAAVGATLPVANIFIGAFSNAGTPSGLRANSYGFTAYGAALTTSVLRLARYNNVQAFAAAVGAQV